METLSLINVGLTTLRGFPKLTSLKNLDISNNLLNEGLENLSVCSNLTHLNLSANKIASLEMLAPLAKIKTLKHLDLINCEIAKCQDYRKNVFNLLPNITYLDGFDIDDGEYEDEDDEDYEENDDDDDDDDDSDEDDDDAKEEDNK